LAQSVIAILGRSEMYASVFTPTAVEEPAARVEYARCAYSQKDDRDVPPV